MGKPCEQSSAAEWWSLLRDSTALGNQLTGLPHNKEASREVSFVSFPTNLATISNVWCLEICAGTLFVMLLKFGAVLSIICGFLMAVYTWTHLLQYIVVVRSFLRMLKLRKLAVCKLFSLRNERSWIWIACRSPILPVGGLQRPCRNRLFSSFWDLAGSGRTSLYM